MKKLFDNILGWMNLDPVLDKKDFLLEHKEKFKPTLDLINKKIDIKDIQNHPDVDYARLPTLLIKKSESTINQTQEVVMSFDNVDVKVANELVESVFEKYKNINSLVDSKILDKALNLNSETINFIRAHKTDQRVANLDLLAVDFTNDMGFEHYTEISSLIDSFKTYDLLHFILMEGRIGILVGCTSILMYHHDLIQFKKASIFLEKSKDILEKRVYYKILNEKIWIKKSVVNNIVINYDKIIFGSVCIVSLASIIVYNYPYSIGNTLDTASNGLVIPHHDHSQYKFDGVWGERLATFQDITGKFVYAITQTISQWQEIAWKGLVGPKIEKIEALITPENVKTVNDIAKEGKDFIKSAISKK